MALEVKIDGSVHAILMKGRLDSSSASEAETTVKAVIDQGRNPSFDRYVRA